MWFEAFRLVNGLATIGFLPYLVKIYLDTRRRFYLLWGVGFAFSGLMLILQTLPVLFNLPQVSLSFHLFLQLTSLIFVVAGLGDLVDELRITLVIISLLSVTVYVIHTILNLEDILLILSLGLYALISLMLPYFRRRFAITIDFFIAGWGLLSFVEIVTRFDLMSMILGEVMAIVGKVLIFLGMLQPRFHFLVDNIKDFLVSSDSSLLYKPINHLVIIEPPSIRDKIDEIQVIVDRLERSRKLGVRTVLITTYDLLTHENFKEFGVAEDDLYIVRMLGGEIGSDFSFEHNTVIRDDIKDLDLVLSNIITYSKENNIGCEVFLYDLSTLMHIHGAKRVYSFMVSKISKLKDSNVCFFAYCYPVTHDNKTDVALIESIADEVQKLE